MRLRKPLDASRSPGLLIKLAEMGYPEACDLQIKVANQRQAGEIPDTLILLEHPPVLTMGRRAEPGNVLVSPAVLSRMGIAVHATERGGDVTYHGPGQLVGYPIVDLTQYDRDVRLYVRRLEEVMISVLRCHGIQADRRPGYPGVWVGEEKIGFIGVHVYRWITRHGFSLNVQPNLDHFTLIRPCGLEGVRITSLAAILGHPVSMDEVRAQTAASFAQVFGLEFRIPLFPYLKSATPPLRQPT